MSLHKGTSKQNANSLVDYIERKGIRVFISDHDLLTGSTSDYRNWIDKHFWTRALDKGLRAEVILPCPDFIGSITLSILYHKSNLSRLVEEGRFIVIEARDGEDALDIAQRITVN